MPPESRDKGKRDDRIPEQTLRNRANQRNFRSRRQEYVRQLESRLQDLERRQMQASKEMQAAAKFVANENLLLRHILKSHSHYTDHDIDTLITHMRSHDTDSRCGSLSQSILDDVENKPRQSSAMRKILQPTTPQSIQGFPAPKPAMSTTPQVRTQEPTIYPSSPTASLVVEQVPSASSDEFACHELHETETRDPSHESFTTSRTATQTISDSNQSVAKGNQDSISCETAAVILADLRLSHLDHIRAQLGCTSTNMCELNHQDLMQMLDESF